MQKKSLDNATPGASNRPRWRGTLSHANPHCEYFYPVTNIWIWEKYDQYIPDLVNEILVTWVSEGDPE